MKASNCLQVINRIVDMVSCWVTALSSLLWWLCALPGVKFSFFRLVDLQYQTVCCVCVIPEDKMLEAPDHEIKRPKGRVLIPPCGFVCDLLSEFVCTNS